MRKIELRIMDKDLNLIYVNDEFTGMSYLKKDLNAMLDELTRSPYNTRSRDSLLAELLTKSMSKYYASYPLDDGPLTREELDEVIRIVGKSIKKGWFG
jgi:hypothetical protein